MDQLTTTASRIPNGIDFAYLLAEWKQMFKHETVAKDVMAGITVALVALPLNLALAIAAGVEPGVGIITGIVAGIIGGLFGGQKFAITGPAAAMAVVLIEAAEHYGIGAVWLLGLIAGVMQIIAGYFRLGRLISFLPMPVIVGFANAIGVLVFCNSLDQFLGLPMRSLAHPGQLPFAGNQFIPDFIADWLHIWRHCIVNQEMNFYAILIGIIALLIAHFTPQITKALPGPLVAVIAGTLVTHLLGFKIPVIKDIAHISALLPMPTVPNLPWNDLMVLFPAAITVFMLGSIESLLSASVADGMAGTTRHHSNQELIGQGLANIVMPFFGGIPVSGVITRTASNIRSGAQTRLAAIAQSLVLMGLIFFLARYVEQIPLAVLAGILMLTGARLIEWDAMYEIWKGSHTETLVVLVTTAASVLIDLTAGMFTGLVLACALFIRQMSDLKLVPHGTWQEQDLALDLPTCKFVRTYVVDGPLFFGAAERFIESIMVVDEIKVVILHMKTVRFLDLTGVRTLLSVQHQLQRHGGRLVLAELPPQALQLLERAGALTKIGSDNIYNEYRIAVADVNAQLLNSTCQSCKKQNGKRSLTSSPAPKDCRLHHALMDQSSQMARMIEATQHTQTKTKAIGLEWLCSVESVDEIPQILRGTPLESLLKGQNLGLIDESLSGGAELVIGMCIDFRKSLSIPKDWAYIIRREGANMEHAEFAIALAMSKGVRHMALIAHNDCAMANTAQHRDQFVSVLTQQIGWSADEAAEFFDSHARSRDIGNEIDFVLQEAERIKSLFSGLKVVPLLFRVDDSKLYLIYDWLIKYAHNDHIMQKIVQRDKQDQLNRA